MEEYVWILLLFGIWIFEVVGKSIRRQRRGQDEELAEARPDPQRSRRELAREVNTAAREAEEALLRWEGRQAAEDRGASAEGRRDAFDAIAAMLAPEPAAIPAWGEPRRPSRVAAEDLPAPPVVTPSRRRRDLPRLSRLTELQRAIVLSEVLESPVALRDGSRASP